MIHDTCNNRERERERERFCGYLGVAVHTNSSNFACVLDTRQQWRAMILHIRVDDGVLIEPHIPESNGTVSRY